MSFQVQQPSPLLSFVFGEGGEGRRMFYKPYILPATLAVCATAAVGVGVLSALDKQGHLVARLPGHVLVLAAPLAGVAVGATWWRKHRWLPYAGLAVAAAAAGGIVWGRASDYAAWSRAAPGQEAMHFGGFVGMLWGWVLCLGFVSLGAAAGLVARRAAKTAEPGAATDAEGVTAS